jgi:uncharacterized integral membrane protein (TIGR00698 family)
LQLEKILVPIGFLISLSPYVNSGMALALGVAIALTAGNPYIARTRKWTKPLLSTSIIGLGAGIDLMVIGRAGLTGVGYTIIGLASTLLLGWLIGKWLKTPSVVSLLVNVGTAICGGSAIAAVSAVIRAEEYETSVALGIVFMLNAIALFLFPPIGHLFNLSETQFGIWSALAIHDTSSVVGATLQYGPHALEVGTTVKLVRALWIIPVALIIAHFYKQPGPDSTGVKAKPKFPLFILGFLTASALTTWIPVLREPGHIVETIARHLLIATLFLIGAGLTRQTLRQVGAKPLLQGVLLWLIVATANLLFVIVTNPA